MIVIERNNTRDKNENLLSAAANGLIQEFESLLLRKELTLNERDSDGNSALLLAAANGQIKMFEYLLENEYSSVSEKNNLGYTPFLLAVRGGQIAMVEYLLAKKYSNINETTAQGDTAQFIAVCQGNIPMVELLIDLPKVDLFKPDQASSGCCNLFLETTFPFSSSEMVAFLLENGVFVDEKSISDHTSLEIVKGDLLGDKKLSGDKDERKLRLKEAAKELLLIASGELLKDPRKAISVLERKLNGRRKVDGNTAQHLAIMNHNSELIDLLMFHGADFEIPNNNDETPLQLLQKNYSDFPRLIVDCHIHNIKLIEKKLDRLKQGNTTEKLFYESDQSYKDIGFDKKEKEDYSECSIVPIFQRRKFRLIHQCKALIEALMILLKKDSILGVNEIRYTTGKLFVDIHSSIYNPVAAYDFLSQVTPTDARHFKFAQSLMAIILMSGTVSCQINVIGKNLPSISIKLENGINYEDQTRRDLRLKTIIKHLLYGCKTSHGDIKKYIADYTLLSEKNLGLENISEINPEFVMALIETLKERNAALRQAEEVIRQRNETIKKIEMTLKEKELEMKRLLEENQQFNQKEKNLQKKSEDYNGRMLLQFESENGKSNPPNANCDLSSGHMHNLGGLGLVGGLGLEITHASRE